MYPEPSIYDCGALWNEMEIYGEDGDIMIVCGCAHCIKKRREEARERNYDDNHEREIGR